MEGAELVVGYEKVRTEDARDEAMTYAERIRFVLYSFQLRKHNHQAVRLIGKKRESTFRCYGHWR